MTYLAEGSSLKDGSNVLAKIAVAKSNGSMCLEREAHMCVVSCSSPRSYSTVSLVSLGRISASSDNPSLRPIDFLTIPKENGDVVVLLLFHPGPNLLGRYLPPSKINELLLADMHGPSRVPPHKDIYMLGMEEPDLEEVEAFDVMDLASFLECVFSLLPDVYTQQHKGSQFKPHIVSSPPTRPASSIVKFVPTPSI